MEIVQKFITKNDCYAANQKRADSRYTTFQTRGPKGLMLHSVGTPQPKAEVFASSWNKGGFETAVHAFTQDDGTVIQCLPWNYRGWHAGGSANDTHIGVEMCEPSDIKYRDPAHSDRFDVVGSLTHARAVVECNYKTARDLFAKLCIDYGLDPMTAIISHSEGYKKGIASGHGDPEHLWSQLGMSYTMDGFRKDVKERMDAMRKAAEPQPEPDPNVPNLDDGPDNLPTNDKAAFKAALLACIEENPKEFAAALNAAGIKATFSA